MYTFDYLYLLDKKVVFLLQTKLTFFILLLLYMDILYIQGYHLILL